jgi:hypothetical protein
MMPDFTRFWKLAARPAVAGRRFVGDIVDLDNKFRQP